MTNPHLYLQLKIFKQYRNSLVNLQFGIVSTSLLTVLLSLFLSLLVCVSHSSLSNSSGETKACETMWCCSIKGKAVKRLGKESRK